MYALESVVLIDGAGALGGILYREMLVRPEGALAPALLVEALDRLGASIYLDAFMAAEACALAQRIDVGVNVARGSLARWEAILRLIERWADPGRIVLEVIESGDGGEDTGRLRAFARAAREIGCRLALDDAGAGAHAGEGFLRALEALAPHYVKLDRSLLGREEDLAAYAGIALSAGAAAVIAEGVEREEQAAAARGCGANAIQGWLTGRTPGAGLELGSGLRVAGAVKAP